MPDSIFGSVLTTAVSAAAFDLGSFLLCTACSLVLGVMITAVYAFRTAFSKSFLIMLALMPAIVQVVIMLVNGNLGAGVAVMGAFSLVRFRSVPGSAKEIGCIFLAMAVGLATGMGYLAIAALFVVIIGAAMLLFTATKFGEPKRQDRELKITIPEGLDYTGVFDDLLEEFTVRWELTQVKTINMGSLFRLTYRVTMRDIAKEKQLIDAIRCRNGNLEIACGRVSTVREEL